MSEPETVKVELEIPINVYEATRKVSERFKESITARAELGQPEKKAFAEEIKQILVS